MVTVGSAELAYVDTETLGLEIELHDIWEIAYAIGNGPVVSAVVPHNINCHDPRALELNGYWNRFPRGAGPYVENVDAAFCSALTDRTLVGANIAFDAVRLERRWGQAPWHYRLVDIESIAMHVFDLPRPKGMKWVADTLRGFEFHITEPEHTAASDVLCLRDCYLALRRFRSVPPELI